MYKGSLSAMPNAKINRPNVLQRNEEDERFSSYESPPHANDDFSDFETSREKEKYKGKGSPSSSNHNTQVLPQELPLQPQTILTATNRHPKSNPPSPTSKKCQQSPSNNQRSSAASRETAKMKENCPLKYNYMEKVERHLTTIQEDAKEDIKDSIASSLNHLRPFSLYRPLSFGGLGLDSMRWNNDSKLYNDPNMALFEKQRLQMLMLEQENIALRERVLLLEKHLNVKNEQRYRKEAEMLAECMSSVVQEEQMSTTRKEAKLKLVEEVAVLQSRCKEMKEEMRLYKEKQEENFAKLTRQREQAKLQVIRLKAAHSYQAKFTEVFLNMVEKLPIDLEEGWSDKRKIAVGWKVVKHLVKKAFKLGIHPPAIAQKY